MIIDGISQEEEDEIKKRFQLFLDDLCKTCHYEVVENVEGKHLLYIGVSTEVHTIPLSLLKGLYAMGWTDSTDWQKKMVGLN